MSIYAIQQYHKELEKIIHFGGSKKETAIRNAFYYLLNEYARTKELMLIAEISTKNKQGKIITPDGTLKDNIRNDWGYWESKDEKDDIDEEIRNKFAIGYPADNILFEDSQTAVLFQHGDEVMRVDMKDEAALHSILTFFLSYERPEVHDFREAIEKFKEDIPNVTVAIREIIEAQQKTNAELQKAQTDFLEMAKTSINPEINEDDVKEMMIQHILSADIFNTIFDEPHFHQENNIARELNKVIDTFFTGNVRRQTLGSIKHYYDTINARAASIADHHEKQKFLKVVYENFYKGYNPKAADRLGIVYTPNEIVNFMIRSTDYLLHKHFGKTLGDKNVDILDPATGTGTFITDIIDYLPKAKLKHKYKNELHANEVAILPYYIANLNIEYTYKQKMGEYAEFDNLCFVDTLDNTGFHWVGKQGDLFGVTAENAERIRKQNEKKISVIIGNPPYNANQQNANDDNKNRVYTDVDKRIKETYIKNSKAQKTKVYDMYSRFFRWASDRLQQEGIVCFISNNSFLNSKTYDGFRKSIQDEFQYAYLIDLGGNIRELSGRDGIFLNEENTIFGSAAAVGIAITFLIRDKRKKLQSCHINYIHPCDIRAKREEKISYLQDNAFEDINFESIIPDNDNNWINLSDNDFETLLSIKNNINPNEQIFKKSFLGVSTNRDEWVYDFNKSDLEKKSKYLVEKYNSGITANIQIEDLKIKWSSDLISKYQLRKKAEFDKINFISTVYRPYVNQFQFTNKLFNDRLTSKHYEIFGQAFCLPNKTICFASYERKPFAYLALDKIQNLNFFGDPANTISLYLYNDSNERIDNITDWSMKEFQDHYNDVSISKESIFNYIYGVLHNPAYRKKYELNLKREFPRIPFYDHFYSWVKWGEQLMNLHINYETVEPYPLKVISKDVNAVNTSAQQKLQKPKLKADKAAGTIELDGLTTLIGIPPIAWTYKLGNRSALEWILDQYKEKKPKDPTIAEKFNTYKFADYKEQVIELLMQICRVSVETMEVVGEMGEISNN